MGNNIAEGSCNQPQAARVGPFLYVLLLSSHVKTYCACLKKEKEGDVCALFFFICNELYKSYTLINYCPLLSCVTPFWGTEKRVRLIC